MRGHGPSGTMDSCGSVDSAQEWYVGTVEGAVILSPEEMIGLYRTLQVIRVWVLARFEMHVYDERWCYATASMNQRRKCLANALLWSRNAKVPFIVLCCLLSSAVKSLSTKRHLQHFISCQISLCSAGSMFSSPNA